MPFQATCVETYDCLFKPRTLIIIPFFEMLSAKGAVLAPEKAPTRQIHLLPCSHVRLPSNGTYSWPERLL